LCHGASREGGGVGGHECVRPFGQRVRLGVIIQVGEGEWFDGGDRQGACLDLIEKGEGFVHLQAAGLDQVAELLALGFDEAIFGGVEEAQAFEEEGEAKQSGIFGPDGGIDGPYGFRCGVGWGGDGCRG
jgi:hypothetical protein